MAASVWMKFSRGVLPSAASLRANDTRGDRALQSERIAEGQHPVAHLHVVAIGQFYRRQRAGALDADDGQVGLRVGLDFDAVELAAVVQADYDLAAALDHVVVGENDARGIDDYARPDATHLTVRNAVACRGGISGNCLKKWRNSGGNMSPKGFSSEGFSGVSSCSCACW